MPVNEARTAASKAKALTQRDLELQRTIATKFYADFRGYCLFNWPWGVKGSALEHDIIDGWQGKFMDDVSESVGVAATVDDALPILEAIASGHGVGKTALVAMGIKWFMATRAHPEVIVTSGKKDQLTGKTWRELAKWNRMALDGHLYQWTATKFYHVLFPETWFAHAIPWSKAAPDNFAGTHEKHVFVIYDESSAIDDIIWETTEGAMTTPGAMWWAFGNPTRNTGRFAQCWGKFKARWRLRQIDSRSARKANQKKIQQWIEDYGEDSDFVRVRVRGMFPRAGSLQFMPNDLVRLAMERDLISSMYGENARIMAVDVARHGGDEIVETRRQGLKVHPQKCWRENPSDPKLLMTLAARIAEHINEWQPDAVFIDATGIGWGVVDRLVQMGFNNIIAVQTAEQALDPKKFFNLRAEIWYKAREWLGAGGCLPDDSQLEGQLTAVEYGFDNSDRYQLEKKEDTKERLEDGESPDRADSFTLTFAAPVLPRRIKESDTWRARLRARTARNRSPMAA